MRCHLLIQQFFQRVLLQVERRKTQSSEYIENLFTPEEDILLKQVHSYFSDKRKFIQLSPLEGKLLYMLIKMNNIENIIEIGTLVGYSTLWMAKAIPECGHIYTIEKNAKNAGVAREHFAKFNKGNITLLEGNATVELDILQKKHNKSFDMIFIDADKSKYCDYLDWSEINVRKGGIIVADNTLLFNTVFLEKPVKDVSSISWKVMREFNNRLSDVKKYNSIIIPTVEGLTVAMKK